MFEVCFFFFFWGGGGGGGGGEGGGLYFVLEAEGNCVFYPSVFS